MACRACGATRAPASGSMFSRDDCPKELSNICGTCIDKFRRFCGETSTTVHRDCSQKCLDTGSDVCDKHCYKLEKWSKQLSHLEQARLIEFLRSKLLNAMRRYRTYGTADRCQALHITSMFSGDAYQCDNFAKDFRDGRPVCWFHKEQNKQVFYTNGKESPIIQCIVQLAKDEPLFMEELTSALGVVRE